MSRSSIVIDFVPIRLTQTPTTYGLSGEADRDRLIERFRLEGVIRRIIRDSLIVVLTNRIRSSKAAPRSIMAKLLLSASTVKIKRRTMCKIRPMTTDDYEAVIDLMKQTPGVSFRDADSFESTVRYLERNPGLSFVAEVDDRVCACVMSGHDGRRGYLQHLIVFPAYRRKGIAKRLVERCLSELERLGILKCHIDVFKTNALGSAYWESQGWKLRTDINRYSYVRTGTENV